MHRYLKRFLPKASVDKDYYIIYKKIRYFSLCKLTGLVPLIISVLQIYYKIVTDR